MRVTGLPTIPSIACGLLAMVPDVHSLPETTKGNWDGTYARYHKWYGWKADWWKIVIFPIGFHVFVIDKLTHKKGGGWNLTGWITEIAWWLFVLYLLIF